MENINTQNVAVLPEAIAAHVKAFAKSKKISAVALQNMMAEAMQMLPQAEKSNENQKPKRNRTAGEKSLAFREKFLQKAPQMSGQVFTIRQIAEEFGLDAPNCSNNLYWLKEQNKIQFTIVGKEKKAAGVRGPKASLLKFA